MTHSLHTGPRSQAESTGSDEPDGSPGLGPVSSAVERRVHIADVAGSIPALATRTPAAFTRPYNLHQTHRLTSVVYIIRSGEFLKVGVADDLARRVREMELGNPHGLTVMAYRTVPRPLVRQIEQHLHAHFAERAVGREWFRDLDHREVLAVLRPLIRQADAFLRKSLEEMVRCAS